MKTTACVVVVLVLLLSACGPMSSREVTAQTDDGGTTLSGSACALDGDCPAGMLCEGCADGVFTCVPGCRTDEQCGPNRRCSHQVQCNTCPCPSGYCELDPCHDFDGDGFAAATTGSCPGKQLGDCDDANAFAHPGGLERCANGVDDDCDGARDQLDSECTMTCNGGRRCNSALNCGESEVCERGCCDQCPAVVSPTTCGATECLVPGGLDARGCRGPDVCVTCSSCSGRYEPVCGKNFATWLNACVANAAGVGVVHDGDCDWREGSLCVDQLDCAGNQFCRDFGGLKRCTRAGSCTVDADCEHLSTTPTCDGGIGSWVCRAERCAATCQ